MRGSRFAKRLTLLGGAALLGMAMAVPAMAQVGPVTDGVEVNGTVVASLELDIPNAAVSFGSVDPDGTETAGTNRSSIAGSNLGACYVADEDIVSTVNSNLDYDGDVSAAEAGASHTAGLDVSNLYWATAETAPFTDPLTAYANCTSGTQFSGTPSLWHDGDATAPEDVYTEEYGLTVDWVDAPGVIDIDVTYSVTQL